MTAGDPIAVAARIPNPALAPLAFPLGTWRTIGTHPLVPGKTFHGRTSFTWADDGAFLVMRSQTTEPEIPDGIAYIGSDDQAGTFTMIYFDQRRVSRCYGIDVGERTLTWRRDEPSFRQAMTITASANGDRLEAQGRMARNGGAWEDDLALTYQRQRGAAE